MYFCNQVQPDRRRRRKRKLDPWAQGGGAIFAEQIIASAIYSEYHET